MMITLDELRRFAIARSLFVPTTLSGALSKLGFVQADPIRAPARAQDLTLRHRVKDYRVGDLERCYSELGIAEDFFINYGFVTDSVQALMHPRRRAVGKRDVRLIGPWHGARWTPVQRKRAQGLLDFVYARGVVHPREVDDHFAHGRVKNYWGGSSNATTHLLDAMHYGGLLRVARRDGGIRIYAAQQHGPAPIDAAEREARIDALVDIAVRIYAPLPVSSLSMVVRRLRHGVPQWQAELTKALQRAKQRLAHAKIDGLEWYWPANEEPARRDAQETVRLLTPFDPVVWDRDRFEQLWGWTYRFEAYTPPAKRIRGYYAMPMLWRDRVVGWGNISQRDGELRSELGYVKSPPRDGAFKRELAAELDRMRAFLRRK
jgi:hypothetical protein